MDVVTSCTAKYLTTSCTDKYQPSSLLRSTCPPPVLRSTCPPPVLWSTCPPSVLDIPAQLLYCKVPAHLLYCEVPAHLLYWEVFSPTGLMLWSISTRPALPRCCCGLLGWLQIKICRSSIFKNLWFIYSEWLLHYKVEIHTHPCTGLICVLRLELLVNKYPHDSQGNVCPDVQV